MKRSAFPLDVLRTLDPTGDAGRAVRASGPSASLYYGGAGVALTLARVAAITGDPVLRTLARAWCAWSRTRAHQPNAWYHEDLGIMEHQVIPGAILLTSVSVALAEALVLAADGDAAGAAAACAEVVASARRHSGEAHDAMSGDAGRLAACSLLIELAASDVGAGIDATLVRACGDALVDGLLAAARPLRAAPPTGFAHAASGVLQAIARWCLVTGRPVPGAILDRADAVCSAAVRNGDGLSWPIDASQLQASWCNGDAGVVIFCVTLAEATGDPRFAETAERAGRALWSRRGEIATPSLCCGAAGIAYALAAIHRVSGQRVWRDRACLLVDAAVAGFGAAPQPGLFTGSLGLHLAAADLRTEAPRFPIYEGATTRGLS